MIRGVVVLCGLLALWLTGPAEVQGADISQLLPLLDRMGEPVFMPKGDKNQVYNVPEEWLSDRYKPLASNVINRFGGSASEHIPVRKITLPDFAVPMSLEKRKNFSLFLPEHRRVASRLIDIFMGMRTLEDFMSAAVYARSNVNPYLFAYAFSVALLHREDTQGANIPLASDMFPDKYVDRAVFSQAREEAATVDNPASRVPLEIPMDYTATDLEPEHRVAYFREDLGINLHHWHWHLVYPFDAALSIVNKDRRGELFYYLHEQIVARYNFERFSNNLMRVKRLTNLREPIPEGYFPKLDTMVASRSWPARVSNTIMSDVNRESDQIQFDLHDLELWRDRIYDVVHTNTYVTDSGQRMNLTVGGGIDVLGNILESSIISPNRNLYGDLHNFGHIAISFSHDPDARHLEPFGVMGDSTTAMRDPVFYRWHAFVDDIFQEYKKRLPPYTTQQLDFPGVKVTGVEVTSAGARNKDVLHTFWQQSDIDLSRGLDFSPRGPVFARLTHLNHMPFTCNINVEHTGSGQREGYVRIFLAPKFDERGVPMQFRDQRTFMIELDKFPFSLSQRNNQIKRPSTMSSVTIPFERTFRNLDVNRPTGGQQLDQFNFCGCGWPQHMLIPKGSPSGLVAQLFVMVSDYSKDKIDQPTGGMCNDASSYCGIRGQKYPDRQAMGFPFDRTARDGVDYIQTFLTPNMFVKDITIMFDNRVQPPTNSNFTVPTRQQQNRQPARQPQRQQNRG